MKQRIVATAAVLLSLVAMALVHFGWLYYRQEGSTASRRIEIKIAPGSSLSDVQARLEEMKLIRNPGVFRWAARITGRDRMIQAGRYLFRRGESIASILGKLSRGEIEYTRVVVPEGLMVREIAGIMRQEVDIDSLAFAETANDTSLLRGFGFAAPSLEGYLFPDTYLFSWPLTPRDIAERMVYRFEVIFDDSLRKRTYSLGMTVNEVVTLASIVQAEAVFDSEMARISAVYHNRIRRGLRLEADPTVAYALGGVRRRLWYKDLRVPSPYNTYRVYGLPPGPICSPGRAALEAAVCPLEECNDLYFVADGTGRHVFSRSLAEHLEAKRRIRASFTRWAGRQEGGTADGDSLAVQETPKQMTE